MPDWHHDCDLAWTDDGGIALDLTTQSRRRSSIRSACAMTWTHVEPAVTRHRLTAETRSELRPECGELGGVASTPTTTRPTSSCAAPATRRTAAALSRLRQCHSDAAPTLRRTRLHPLARRRHTSPTRTPLGFHPRADDQRGGLGGNGAGRSAHQWIELYNSGTLWTVVLETAGPVEFASGRLHCLDLRGTCDPGDYFLLAR